MAENQALAILHIVMPSGATRPQPITETSVTIGRTPDNEVQLPETKVSRRHARLLLEGDRIHLVDLKSTNGTFVGDSKLTPNQPYPLKFGQDFHIGNYTLRLESTGAVVVGEARPVPEPRERKEELQIHIGVTDAPVMPPQPPEPPPPPEDGRSAYDKAFGLRPDRSRYLQYLPPIYDEHQFLGRFLLAFEGVLLPIEQTVDNFDLYLQPRTTPLHFLDHLAGWLGLTLDEKWPEDKRRAVVAEAADLFRRRGTRRGLSRHLEIYTDVEPEITEPEDRPHHFHVLLRPPAGATLHRATIERIIQANKPAHATFSLEIRPTS